MEPTRDDLLANIGPIAEIAQPPPPPPPPASAALAVARAKLRPPVRTSSILPLLIASALCAGAAMSLAAAIIVGPPSVAPRVDVNPWVR